MTIANITDFVIFGAHADTKPLAGIAANTLFFEIDTGDIYKFTGGVWSLFSGRAKQETLSNKTLTFPVISTISNTGTITLPTGNRTLVGRDTTDTLSNKTLTFPVISTISNGGVITLPSGTRTLVARDTADTLLSKTINTNSNTVTATSQAAGDILINNGTQFIRLARGTSGQVLTATASTVNWAAASGGSGAGTGVANTWTAAQTFNDTMFLLRNPANTFSVTLGSGAQTAARTVTLPVIAANDTFQLLTATQTQTNKTIAVDSNTIKHSTSNTAGDILKSDGTKYNRLAIGTANQVLTVNSSATDIAWAAATGGGGSITTTNFTYTYFIYKSGTTYFAQTGNGPTPSLTSNTDFKTLFQAVINAISPKGTPTNIHIGTGDYLVETQITIPGTAVGNIAIIGSGIGLTNFVMTSAWNNAALNTYIIQIGNLFNTGVSFTGTLTANCTIRSISCTVSVADAVKFAVGDYVLMTSTAAWSAAPSSNSKQGEIKKITAINGGTGVITFDVPTYDTYTTATTAVIYKLSNMLNDIAFEGISFVKGTGLTSDITGTTGANFFTAFFVDNLQLSSMQVIDNVAQYDSGISLISCINSEVDNCFFFQNPSQTYNLQYGLALEACCQNISVTNCRSFGRFRHPFETANGLAGAGYQGVARNISLAGITTQGSEVASFSTHPDGELISFTNCKIGGTTQTSGAVGFEMRARKSTLANCSCEAANTYGFQLSGDANDCELSNCTARGCLSSGLRIINDYLGVKRTRIIGGNYSENGNNGIHVDTACDYLQIIGTIVRNNSNQGIYIANSDNLILTNNVVTGNTNRGIWLDASSAAIINSQVMENNVAGNTLPNISITGLYGGNTVIKDNIGGIPNSVSQFTDPFTRRTGSYQPTGNGTTNITVGALHGMLSSHTPTGAGTNSNTYDTTEGVIINLATTATAGQNAGLVSPTGGIGVGRRLFGMRTKIRSKVDTVLAGVSRFYFGFTSATALPFTDNPLAITDSGIIVGFSSADTTYQIYSNDGATSVTKTAITGNIAKNTNYHNIEIIWLASGNITVIFDDVPQLISTDLPPTTTNLFFNAVAQNVTAAIRTHSITGIWLEAEK